MCPQARMPMAEINMTANTAQSQSEPCVVMSMLAFFWLPNNAYVRGRNEGEGATEETREDGGRGRRRTTVSGVLGLHTVGTTYRVEVEDIVALGELKGGVHGDGARAGDEGDARSRVAKEAGAWPGRGSTTSANDVCWCASGSRETEEGKRSERWAREVVRLEASFLHPRCGRASIFGQSCGPATLKMITAMRKSQRRERRGGSGVRDLEDLRRSRHGPGGRSRVGQPISP